METNKITTSLYNDTGIIKIKGNFDFHLHREFRSACEKMVANEAVKTLQLDFSEVLYIDSSALGILLLLKEKVINNKQSVELINVQKTVKQVFEIACFHKLFTIR